MKKKYFVLLIWIIALLILGLINPEKYEKKDIKYLNGNILPVLKVNYIDVSQGDSIFIEFPNKTTMLIDAGERNSSTIEYINNLGYKKIDYLVATHPHSDHIGGMEEVIDNFEIGAIYMPKLVHNTKTYEDLLLKINEKNLKIKTGKSGVNILTNNDLSVDIIAPNSTSYNDINNYSIVIMLTYGNNKFLFMGDAEVLSENEIKSDVNADVIKVGHHGSSTSSGIDFINKIRPKYAIISVGKDNIYNLPSDSILERFEKLDTIIYRTDLNGNIVITSDGINLDIDLEKGDL